MTFSILNRAVRAITAPLVLSITACPAFAQTVWQNPDGGSWFNPGNWNTDTVPTGSDPVTVGDGGTAKVDDGASGRAGTAASISIGDASGVAITNGATLVSGPIRGAGTLTFDDGTLVSPSTSGGQSAIGSNVVVNSGGGTIDNNNGALTISGNITGTGALTFRSTGGTFNGNDYDSTSVALTGTNSYSGGTIIRSGSQVQVRADNALGSGSLEVDGSSVVDLAGFSQNVTALTGSGKIAGTGARNGAQNSITIETLGVQSGSYAGTLDAGDHFVTGNGGTQVVDYGDIHLNKTGSGTLTLTGQNSFGLYGGSTTIAGGTIAIGNGSALGTGTVTLDGGRLQAVLNAGGMTIGNTISLGSRGGTVDSNGNHYIELTGAITGGSGARPLTLTSSVDDVVTGTGRAQDILLSGANSSTAGTIVSGVSNIILNAGNALGRGSLAIGNDAWVELGGSYTQEVTTLSGGGVVFANGFRSATGRGVATLSIGSGRYAGILSDGYSYDGTASYAGTLSLQKVTAGTLVLSGNSYYAGATSVLAGTLRAGSQTSLSDNSAFTIAAGATLDLDGFDNNIGSLAGAGRVINSGRTGARLRAGDDNTSTVFSGIIENETSQLGFTKRGTGTLTLSGANTYTGTTNLRDGVLVVTNSTVSGTTPVSSSIGAGGLQLYGGTLRAAGGLTLANPIEVDGDGAVIDNAGHNLVLSGAITSGTAPGLLVFANSAAGSGATILQGVNTYASGSVISGSVRLGAPNALGSGQVVLGGGVLDLAGFDQTTSALSGTGTVFNSGTQASATLTVGSAGSSSYGGRLADGTSSLRLAKIGAGVQVLTGANSFSGGTALDAGTVAIDNGAALGTGPVTMAQGTTLTFLDSGIDLANVIRFPQKGDPTIDTGPNDATISGSISGQGDLEKLGTGTLTLSGTNTYTGATIVQQGTLLVNGSTADSLASVASGARLGGFGTVGGIDVLGGGTLAPGVRVPYSTMQVAGSATFAGGSTYAVNINAGGQTDAIAASGAATINGGTVAVSAASGSYSPTSRYTILTAAGGRTGQFSDITASTNLAFLSPTLSYDADHAYIGFAQTAPIGSQATTQNQASAAAAVGSLAPGDPVYGAVLTQSPAGAQQALKSLSGEAHASTPAVAVTSAGAARGVVLDRFWNIPVDGGGDAVSVLDQFGSTTSPALLRCYTPEQAGGGGVAPSTYTVWGQAVGNFFRNGGDGNASAVDSTLGGVSFGIDTKVDAALFNNWRVGVAGGYTNSAYSVTQGGGSGTFENAFGTLYGGARYGAVDVKLGASYGDNTTTTRRTVAFPGFIEQERAKYGGDTVQGFGELGYRFGFPQAVLEPILGGGVTHVHGDAYREEGGAAALVGSAQDTDVGYTTLGFRGEVTPVADLPVVARVLLGWEHSYGDINPGATLAFASGSVAFNSYGTPIDRDAAVAEANVVWRATPATSVSLAYTGQVGPRNNANGVRGRMDYRF